MPLPTLTIDPQVLAALKVAFPKPPSSAQRQLDNYVRSLAQLLDDAVVAGLGNHKTRVYTISLNVLQQEGGRIGPQKIRVHKWLQDNQLSLVDTFSKGTKIKGKKSISSIMLTKRVTGVVDPLAQSGLLNGNVTLACVSAYLQSATLIQDPTQLSNLFPESKKDPSGLWMQAFHVAPIDLKSIQSFAVIALNDPSLTRQEKLQITRQIEHIFSVAVVCSGNYPQRPKPSLFGRTYYTGLSVQNVSRTLRRAMLGDCWEYDMSSCAIAWKMGFARDYINQKAIGSSVQQEFPALLNFLTSKAGLYNRIRATLYPNAPASEHADQITQLKTAFTAIGFGARHSSAGYWYDATGDLQVNALFDTFDRDETTYQAFISCSDVVGFIDDNDKFDTFIFDWIKQTNPQLLNNPIVRTAKRASQSKVLAFYFQHGESQVMNMVNDQVEQLGHKVLARIHDAIILRDQLDSADKLKIEQFIKASTKNPYWRLDEKQLLGF